MMGNGRWAIGNGQWATGNRLAGLAIASCFLLPASCSSKPDPRTEPFPVPTDTTPPTPQSRISPRTVVGTYQGDVLITNPAGRERGRSGRNSRTQIRLESTPAAVPAEGAASATQYNATITLPGYSRAPRGRTGQSAAWWPSTLDSVVVQFTGQQGNHIQLRGALTGNTMRGEIWYISGSTSSSFQLGTFNAVRIRRQ